MINNLDEIPDFVTPVRRSSSTSTTLLALQISLLSLYTSVTLNLLPRHKPPHTHKKSSACPADVKGPQLPQEIETQRVSVVFSEHFQVLVSSTVSTLTPLMETRVTGTLAFVFATLSCRWLYSHHVTKLPNTQAGTLVCHSNQCTLLSPTQGFHTYNHINASGQNLYRNIFQS